MAKKSNVDEQIKVFLDGKKKPKIGIIGYIFGTLFTLLLAASLISLVLILPLLVLLIIKNIL